jgi:uncharacterized protein (TIGR02145 family)
MKSLKSLLIAGTAIFLVIALTQMYISKTAKTFTDTRDGKTYRTVKIGTQVWMAENLNYVTDSSWCYDNNSDNCKKYGRLYNWDAAMKVCPAGWHLPSDAEWTTLMDYIGGSLTAGEKLKANSSFWNTNTGTDEFGFAALPGGYGNSGRGPTEDDDDACVNCVGFGNLGNNGVWWSSSEIDASYAYDWNIFSTAKYAYKGLESVKIDFFSSVRCLKD